MYSSVEDFSTGLPSTSVVSITWQHCTLPLLFPSPFPYSFYTVSKHVNIMNIILDNPCDAGRCLVDGRCYHSLNIVANVAVH